jgi:hypothetical protein
LGPGYRTQSSDTSIEAEQVLFAIWRSWTPQQKIECMERLWGDARALSLAGLRLRHPEASLEERELREAALRLGPELARAVYKDRYDALVR